MANSRKTLLKLLYWSGGNAASRLVLRNRPRIVMLHKVAGDGPAESPLFNVSMLKIVLRALSRNYRTLLLKDFLELQQSPGGWPKNAAVLTFDDGFRSFYELVFPLLKEFGVPATVFVCPNLVDRDSCIWPDRLAALYAAGFQHPAGKSLPTFEAELKKMDAVPRDTILDQAQASLGATFPAEIPAAHRLMDWDMLREVSRSPLVEIGSHTLTHPILSRESLAVAREEIFGSKARLEAMLGIEIKTFCYPNGQPDDYTPEQSRLIEEAGYSGAVAAHFGIVEPDSDRFALPRISGDHRDPYAFFKFLDGIEHFQHRVLG